MRLISSLRKTMVVLNILCILLLSSTSCDLVAGLKAQAESLNIPSYIKSHFPNMEISNQLEANLKEFLDDSFSNTFQTKSPSYQHNSLQFHEEPGTGSVRFIYPNKLVLSHYMLSKPLRHPITGRPAIVVNRNTFRWGLNDDEDNYKQTFHHTNLQAETPSFVPYAGARSLTNISKFLHLFTIIYTPYMAETVMGTERIMSNWNYLPSMCDLICMSEICIFPITFEKIKHHLF